MAARDRFNNYLGERVSPLQRYIQRACDPSNFEPNLALNLEITDLINQKKGNAPREAAVAIVNLINSRNPNVSLLALALLDICVKNCGYPFHLQISTKDFLNELVRRFPEKPPVRPNRVQLKILEAIEEWRSTICETSKYKEDLGFIRDMHRLLSYKGYMFPEVRKDDVAVLNESEQLKSAEEMEEEERAAHAAKLQELIRRGTPADLQEANQLMKIMTGYDTKNRTDYRAKAAEEVQKLKQKARLLEEMLQKAKPGENIGQQDLFSELAGALKTSQPKLQKMVEEESDDTEAVMKLLELNDMINVILERYNLVKRGELEKASSLPVTSVGASQGISNYAKQEEPSLIDFDNDANDGSFSTGSKSGKAPATDETTLEEDLLGLSFDGSTSSVTFGQGGGIALGFGANTSVPGPPLLSSTTQSNTAGKTQLTPSSSLAPVFSSREFSNLQKSPSTKPASASSNAFSMFTTRTPPPTASPLLHVQHQQRPASQPHLNVHNGNENEDWTDFTTALPPSSNLPILAANEALVVSSSIQIVVEVNRLRNIPDGPVIIKAKFSNPSTQLIQNLTFQMAVPKAFQLKMEPQSGRNIPAGQRDGVIQIIRVAGVGKAQGPSLKIKWKVSYILGTDPLTSTAHEEQGVLESLPVS